MDNKSKEEMSMSQISIKVGDKFTLAESGKSCKGHDVLFGRSVKTGKKMKVKTPYQFTVVELFTGSK